MSQESIIVQPMVKDYLTTLIMMMNYSCGKVDQQKVFMPDSQLWPLSEILTIAFSDMSQVEFEPLQNLCSHRTTLNTPSTPALLLAWLKLKKYVSICPAIASAVCRAFGGKAPLEAHKWAANLERVLSNGH